MQLTSQQHDVTWHSVLHVTVYPEGSLTSGEIDVEYYKNLLPKTDVLWRWIVHRTLELTSWGEILDNRNAEIRIKNIEISMFQTFRLWFFEQRFWLFDSLLINVLNWTAHLLSPCHVISLPQDKDYVHDGHNEGEDPEGFPKTWDGNASCVVLLWAGLFW